MYDVKKVSDYIGKLFEERLTENMLDEMHLLTGDTTKNYPIAKEKLAELMDNDFIDNLHHFLSKDYCNQSIKYKNK